MAVIMEALKKHTDGTPVGLLDALRDRRSIRQYTDQAVEAHTLKTLLEYAVDAPSAVNSQPWSFVIIQNRNLLDEISFEAKKTLANDPRWKSEAQHGQNQIVDPAFNIFYKASTLVIVCSNREEPAPEIDCYLACQNLMLAAYAMGLGTCPIGLAWDVLRTEEMKRKLKIPEGHYPVLPIIVGYPSEEAPKTQRDPPRILNWIAA
jgi:nitroreductase